MDMLKENGACLLKSLESYDGKLALEPHVLRLVHTSSHTQQVVSNKTQRLVCCSQTNG